MAGVNYRGAHIRGLVSLGSEVGENNKDDDGHVVEVPLLFG